MADQEPPPKPPSLPAELVKDFVIAGHGDLDKVRQMLDKEPALLNASWDWGGGDFESAVEGAGHVGNKACARFLIEQGARANLFQFAMLGQTEVVRSMLEANPNLIRSTGPHGFSLLHHARVGGEEAREVLDLLLERGATE